MRFGQNVCHRWKRGRSDVWRGNEKGGRIEQGFRGLQGVMLERHRVKFKRRVGRSMIGRSQGRTQKKKESRGYCGGGKRPLDEINYVSKKTGEPAGLTSPESTNS